MQTKQTKQDARNLIRTLVADDAERAPEVPVETNGAKALDGWLAAAADAGDRDTLESLKAAIDVLGRDEAEAVWERAARRRTRTQPAKGATS